MRRSVKKAKKVVRWKEHEEQIKERRMGISMDLAKVSIHS